MQKNKKTIITANEGIVFTFNEPKGKPKINPDAPCPICGGCIWFVDDKYKCGWCGYDGINTNQSRALKR